MKTYICIALCVLLASNLQAAPDVVVDRPADQGFDAASSSGSGRDASATASTGAKASTATLDSDTADALSQANANDLAAQVKRSLGDKGSILTAQDQLNLATLLSNAKTVGWDNFEQRLEATFGLKVTMADVIDALEKVNNKGILNSMLNTMSTLSAKLKSSISDFLFSSSSGTTITSDSNGITIQNGDTTHTFTSTPTGVQKSTTIVNPDGTITQITGPQSGSSTGPKHTTVSGTSGSESAAEVGSISSVQDSTFVQTPPAPEPAAASAPKPSGDQILQAQAFLKDRKLLDTSFFSSQGADGYYIKNGSRNNDDTQMVTTTINSDGTRRQLDPTNLDDAYKMLGIKDLSVTYPSEIQAHYDKFLAIEKAKRTSSAQPTSYEKLLNAAFKTLKDNLFSIDQAQLSATLNPAPGSRGIAVADVFNAFHLDPNNDSYLKALNTIKYMQKKYAGSPDMLALVNKAADIIKGKFQNKINAYKGSLTDTMAILNAQDTLQAAGIPNPLFTS